MATKSVVYTKDTKGLVRKIGLWKSISSAASKGGRSISDSNPIHDVSSRLETIDGTKGDAKPVDIHREGNDCNASKKCSPHLEDTDDNGKQKRQKGVQNFIDLTDNPEPLPVISNEKGSLQQQAQEVIDLTDVPAQSPVMSNRDGDTSKYEGVSFSKAKKKWEAKIRICGKLHHIGSYDNEKEAADGYARAVSTYKAMDSDGRQREQKFIDLTDIPQQLPIMSNRKDGTSKYQGVYFCGRSNKWRADITIDGKQHYIGRYDTEENAAVDYARAVFKYKTRGQREQKIIDLTDITPQVPTRSNKRGHLQQKGQKFIDLSDVPAQPPIMSNRNGGSSKYTGVYFDKAQKKWRAEITIDGKRRHIGRYDNEEDAAVDYGRAVFKYKPRDSEGRSRQREHKVIDLTDVPEEVPMRNNKGHLQQQMQKMVIDLTDVPEQPQIISENTGDTSKYKGVSFDKTRKNDGADKNDETNGLEGGCSEAASKCGGAISVGDSFHDVSLQNTPNDDAKAKAESEDVCRKNDASEKRLPLLEDTSKKRPLPLEHTDDKGGQKRRKGVKKIIDLTDVPAQQLIMSKNKNGSSRYLGVHFNKEKNKWVAKIRIDGKDHLIGYYDNEDEAAFDYARAVFKCRPGVQQFIDLSDVPEQLPIISNGGGTSKYRGVCFDKTNKKWKANIRFDGKKHHIGQYDNEEEAAVDYARAVLKYVRGKSEDRSQSEQKIIDLTDVPSQVRIRNNEDEGHLQQQMQKKFIDLTDFPEQPQIISESTGVSSKYKGVSSDKARGNDG